jgi:hypothetical protein
VHVRGELLLVTVEAPIKHMVRHLEPHTLATRRPSVTLLLACEAIEEPR